MVLATAAAPQEQGATRAAFQFAHRFLQREMRQGSATSIEKRTVGTVVCGLLLASTVSNTSEEARWITLFTEPSVYFYCVLRERAWFQSCLSAMLSYLFLYVWMSKLP